MSAHHVCITLLFAGCLASAVTEDQSAEIAASVDAAAAEAGGQGLLLYQSEYVNLTIAGTTTDGVPFAIVAGRHGPHFPYFNDESEWDSVLLSVGDRGYAATARDLPGLAIEIDLGGPDRGRAQLAYEGPVRDDAGGETWVSFSIDVRYVRFAPIQLGKRWDFLDVEEIPGMRWQPFALEGRHGLGEGIVVDGSPHAVLTSTGQLEHGVLSGFRAPALAFSYDYLAVASDAGEWAYVDFTSHALHPDGALGRLVDWTATTFASDAITLQGRRLIQGNVFGVQPPDRVIVDDLVDLGLALLDRQLVQTVDAQGRAAFGLREVFTAK